MFLNEWKTVKIVIKGSWQGFFELESTLPIINDLKLDGQTASGISLWIDACTEGYFRV